MRISRKKISENTFFFKDYYILHLGVVFSNLVVRRVCTLPPPWFFPVPERVINWLLVSESIINCFSPDLIKNTMVGRFFLRQVANDPLLYACADACVRLLFATKAEQVVVMVVTSWVTFVGACSGGLVVSWDPVDCASPENDKHLHTIAISSFVAPLHRGQCLQTN